MAAADGGARRCSYASPPETWQSVEILESVGREAHRKPRETDRYSEQTQSQFA